MGQKGLLKESLVALGRIAAPYGIKGWVHVQSYTQPASNILRYKTWYLLDQEAKPLRVLEGRSLSKGCVVALEGFDNPERAAELRHAMVGVPRTNLPPLEEGVYYWADLIGMQVHNQACNAVVPTIGRVVQIFEAGANDVLVVEAEGPIVSKPVLIPFLMESVITEVDQEAGWIRLQWDEWF